MTIKISKEDVDSLNSMLKLLLEKTQVTLNKANFAKTYYYKDKERLSEILILYGYAKKHKYYDDILCKTEQTQSALTLNFFENLYNEGISIANKTTKEYEKLELEIEALKKKNGLIKPAFVISIISVILAFISLFLKM